jgi:uncharacterized glyoxalase superfamily protein PhnB
MNEQWYARPVLFVADIDRAIHFYVNGLGFTESWRYEDAGKALVAQLERQNCALIFSSQWPDKVGKGMMFISLEIEAEPHELREKATLALDRLRAELQSRGVEVKDGEWGYRVLIVTDPDGNELYFNYPHAGETTATQ